MTASPATPLAEPSGAPAAAVPFKAEWQTDAQGALLRLEGDGRGHSDLPAPPTGLPAGATWRVDGQALTHYDSPLAAALWALGRQGGRTLDTSALPQGLRKVLALAATNPAAATAPADEEAHGLLARIGLNLRHRTEGARGDAGLRGPGAAGHRPLGAHRHPPCAVKTCCTSCRPPGRPACPSSRW